MIWDFPYFKCKYLVIKKYPHRELLLWQSGLWISCCLCGNVDLMPGLEQRVKDLELPQLWWRLKLRLGFDPLPLGTFVSCGCSQKKQKQKQSPSEHCFSSVPQILMSYFHFHSVQSIFHFSWDFLFDASVI